MKFGFLAFGGSMLAGQLRKWSRGASHRRYPQAASELGLQYEDVDGLTLGRLRGELRGLRVLIVPEQGRIALEASQPFALCLRNYEHYKRTPASREPFSLGERGMDKWMVNRYCQVGLAEQLHEDVRLVELLHGLRPFKDQLRQFSLDETRVECVLDYGKPPYIPAAAIGHLLPPLLALAEHCAAIQKRSHGFS